jgi:hypothetical protein
LCDEIIEMGKAAEQERAEIRGAVSTHTFNRAVDAGMARRKAISDQRGGEYGDTWALENQITVFLDATLRRILPPEVYARITPEEKRLVILGSLNDVKLSRLRGPWKLDTTDDLGNYGDAYGTLRQEYEEGAS